MQISNVKAELAILPVLKKIGFSICTLMFVDIEVVFCILVC